MITQVLFLTCASVCLLQPSSTTPASRGQPWSYLTDNLSPLSDFEDIATAQRFNRGAKEEDSSTFSESADDYPADKIKELITENPSLNIFFQKTKVPNFGHRHNSFDQAEDESMCNTSFNTKWPQKLKNRKGMMKFIVNMEKSYQPVYVETCKKNAVCTLKEFFPLEYQSQCKQKYSVVRLVVLNGDNDSTLAIDEFDVPCGCVCSIKKT